MNSNYATINHLPAAVDARDGDCMYVRNCECGAYVDDSAPTVADGTPNGLLMCRDCARIALSEEIGDAYYAELVEGALAAVRAARDRRLRILQAPAPRPMAPAYAMIGNGLFVRTGAGRKRARRY
jgi:hypothetical protein